MESHSHDSTVRSEGSAVKHTRRLRTPLMALAGTLALAACGPARYPKSYVLSFPTSTPPVSPLLQARGPVVVRDFQCPEYLCEGRIVYRPSAQEVGYYEFHRWATNPRQMITQYVAYAIQTTALFKAVALDEVGIQPAYLLTGNIQRLEELDQGGDVRAVCTISTQLINAETKSVVWHHTATETVPVQSRNIPGIVSSLSTAARMTVDDLVKSLQETLASTRTQ
jgi:ABC-type uncharacterized transport system auxiliary subunit